ncbi:organic cation transporter protein-like [Brevipalpus obovatus]|uniref:organic cation transporter protein-like n=1 Tax=Brevipalpus obovatus TaxID=246614 RepID=UPI003D9F9C17
MDAVDEPEGPRPAEKDNLVNSLEGDDDGPIEHVSDLIGSWGPFQRRLFPLVIIVYAISPFSNASLEFYMVKSNYWCKSENPEVISFTQARSCQVDTCSEWIHNTTRTTLVKEWNLICDRFWLASLVLSAYQFGYLISSFVIGIISDRYGRKFAVIVCLIIEIICFLGGATAPSVEVFLIFRFIAGIGGYGRFLGLLLVLVETVGPKLRGKIVAAYEWIWHCGILVMILVTYYVENFRHLYLGVALYQFLCLFLMIFKVQESIRWQLATGRLDSARRTLHENVQLNSDQEKAAFERKLDKLSRFLLKHNSAQERSKTIIDIWRVPRLLRYCLTLYIFWFVQTFFFYGLKYNALDLTGNYFINMAMIQQSSLIANIFVFLKVEKFRRKTLLFACMAIASISLFTTIPLAVNHIFFRNIVLMIGNFAIAMNSMVIYTYTAELFPTTMRHLALGSCSVFGRVGSISAPFIIQLNRYMSIQFTLCIFASLGVLGALISLLLPETRGKEIPDTVQDMLEMTGEKAEKQTVTSK